MYTIQILETVIDYSRVGLSSLHLLTWLKPGILKYIFFIFDLKIINVFDTEPFWVKPIEGNVNHWINIEVKNEKKISK